MSHIARKLLTGRGINEIPFFIGAPVRWLEKYSRNCYFTDAHPMFPSSRPPCPVKKETSPTDSNVCHPVDYAAILNLFRRRIYVYLENNQPSFSFNLYFSTSTLFFSLSLLPPSLSFFHRWFHQVLLGKRKLLIYFIFDARHRYNVKLFNLPGLTGISISRRKDQNSLIYCFVPSRPFSHFLCPAFLFLVFFFDHPSLFGERRTIIGIGTKQRARKFDSKFVTSFRSQRDVSSQLYRPLRASSDYIL